jgi:hypothetical protein
MTAFGIKPGVTGWFESVIGERKNSKMHQPGFPRIVTDAVDRCHPARRMNRENRTNFYCRNNLKIERILVPPGGLNKLPGGNGRYDACCRYNRTNFPANNIFFFRFPYRL